MRANFARHGRRLLVHRTRAPSCSLVRSSPSPRRLPPSTPTLCPRFERTFFNVLFQKPPRDIRQPEYEPGWMQIMVWRSRMLDNLRPPPRRDLMEAWRRLMQAKLKSRVPLNSTQALQCRRLLAYLAEQRVSLHEDRNVKPLAAADLAMARQVLLELEPSETTQNHVDFARALHKAWTEGDFARKPRAVELQWTYLVRALSLYGGGVEAKEMLEQKWDVAEYAVYLTQDDQLLEVVARALAREGKEAEMLELVNHAQSRGIALDAKLQSVIVRYFASRDRIEETKAWFTARIEQPQCHPDTYRAVASFARRNKLQEWAMPFFIELGESTPKKQYWNVLLQSILLMGRSLSQVGTMMDHMVDRGGDIQPTIHTINGLLSVAVELQNYQLGQDVLQLGNDKGLKMDGESYMHMLRLCIDAKDFDRAQRAYEQVTSLEPWGSDSKSDLQPQFGRLVNHYLVTLAQQTPPRFPLLLSILNTAEELGLRLAPATIAALCLRFLENDQHFDVMDILSINTFLFSDAERQVVQAAFVRFCLDPRTSTARAWGGYQLLQQFFEDTSVARRTRLMAAFFARKRADMAAHVFGHMRQHRSKSLHPRIETYIACLEGLARCPDLPGLEMVHNMLKMDTTVQTTTALQTALMMAFAACDRPLAALDVWTQITQSREGPSYATLEAVFWTLERKPGGYKMAREIWDRIERMDLEVSARVYNAYIGAVAGAGSEKEIRALIMKMPAVVGVEPEPITLGIAYNALPGRELQNEFQTWAKLRYKEQWEELSKAGRRMNEYSLCQFKIDRNMRAEVEGAERVAEEAV
ncbi:complex I intermediate-associated 84 [Cordyceps militaris]|uniref:Complex I intermediate-associated 84 n=1 Tax=Cordyceps militaris TaxID=73501 RepID=A0A2H4ST25_CORMI|nr:complex I intermediate-associated 84 [Cordyceps militaris]